MLELFKVAEISSLQVDQANELVTAKVDALCEFEEHILIPDLENLERDEMRISAEIGTVAAMLAHAKGLERKAKRNLKKFRAVRFCQILDEENMKRAGDPKPGREPGAEKINNRIDGEEQVQKLEDIVEHTTETVEFLQAYLKALEVKTTILPGMQGRANALARG